MFNSHPSSNSNVLQYVITGLYIYLLVLEWFSSLYRALVALVQQHGMVAACAVYPYFEGWRNLITSVSYLIASVIGP